VDDVVEAYLRIRDRMAALTRAAPPAQLEARVPACPGWTAADLVAHCVGIPAALAAGDLPDGDLQGWLDGLVTRRRGRPVDELLEEWTTADAALPGLLGGPGGQLFVDLGVHEHDLRGALGAPDHTALEPDLLLPRSLGLLAGLLEDAGLGSIAVEHGPDRWRSHDAEPGWVLVVEPWEAARAVNSRRTADEVRALPHRGDVEPYLAVLDAHLPLPARSLGEA
jgi:hypothetical protein